MRRLLHRLEKARKGLAGAELRIKIEAYTQGDLSRALRRLQREQLQVAQVVAVLNGLQPGHRVDRRVPSEMVQAMGDCYLTVFEDQQNYVWTLRSARGRSF